MMSHRCDRYINRNGQVMGEFGIPRIELRGPGCINGTGRCNVAGERGRCTNRFGTGNDFVNRPDDEEVMGAGERRRCFMDEVLGESGRHRCFRDNVQGTGGRKRHWDCCECLETPFIVPR